MKTRLLAISGSSRQDSVNMRLLNTATDIARRQGAEVNVLDLRTLALPLYDGDLEAASGLPEGCLHLKPVSYTHLDVYKRQISFHIQLAFVYFIKFSF